MSPKKRKKKEAVEQPSWFKGRLVLCVLGAAEITEEREKKKKMRAVTLGLSRPGLPDLLSIGDKKGGVITALPFR